MIRRLQACGCLLRPAAGWWLHCWGKLQIRRRTRKLTRVKTGKRFSRELTPMSPGDRLTRRIFSALVLSLGLFRPTRAREAKGSSPFDVLLESNHRVALRDGVKLATDVYRPASNRQAVAGRFPVILERTPYGRNV